MLKYSDFDAETFLNYSVNDKQILMCYNLSKAGDSINDFACREKGVVNRTVET